MSHSFHKSCQRGCGEMQLDGANGCRSFHLFHLSFHVSFSETGKPRKAPESAGNGNQARIGRQFFFVKRKAGCLGSVAPWPRGSVALFPFDSSMIFPWILPCSHATCQRVSTCGNMWQHVSWGKASCREAICTSHDLIMHRLHRSNSLRFPLKDFGCTGSVSE